MIAYPFFSVTETGAQAGNTYLAQCASQASRQSTFIMQGPVSQPLKGPLLRLQVSATWRPHRRRTTMRKSIHIVAIASCLAAPLALAQSQSSTSARPPATTADTPQAHPADATTAHAATAKSQSVFGQAMNELIRSVDESHARRAQGAQAQQNQGVLPMATNDVVVDARAGAAASGSENAGAQTSSPADNATSTPLEARTPADARGEHHDRVAVQSEPGGSR
jgi:hypothetical protein